MSDLLDDAADLLARVVIEEMVSEGELADVLRRSAQESSNVSILQKACDLLLLVSRKSEVEEIDLNIQLHHSILNAIRRKFGDACVDRLEEGSADHEDDSFDTCSSSWISDDLPRLYGFIKAAYKNIGVELEKPKTRWEAVEFFRNFMKSDPYCEMDCERFPVHSYYDYNLNVVLSECSFGFLINDGVSGDSYSVDDIPF